MKRPATPSRGEKRGKIERLEAVSAQYWQDDLDQLDALELQWKRDQVPYLRRAALHIGVLVLLASGAPFKSNGRYGRFTAEELAVELGPILAPAAQFLERHGYSIIPVPTPIVTLVERLSGPYPGSNSGTTELLELLQRRESSAELSEEFTAQYWRDDLDQLKALDTQRNRDLASFLRRAAVSIGVRVLSASGAPYRRTGKYGQYSAAELVAELGPLLASPIQFLERQGYSVIPVPSVVTTLLGLLVRIVEQGKALLPGSPAGMSRDPRAEQAVTETATEETSQARAAEARAMPNKETRQRMRFTEDGTI